MNANSRMKQKIKMIQDIQRHSLRVLIHQSGLVTVWDKQDPSLEWDCYSLEVAHAGIMDLFQGAKS